MDMHLHVQSCFSKLNLGHMHCFFTSLPYALTVCSVSSCAFNIHVHTFCKCFRDPHIQVYSTYYIHLGVGRCVLLVHRKLCEVMAVSAAAPAECSSLSSATVISAVEENGAPHS